MAPPTALESEHIDLFVLLVILGAIVRIARYFYKAILDTIPTHEREATRTQQTATRIGNAVTVFCALFVYLQTYDSVVFDFGIGQPIALVGNLHLAQQAETTHLTYTDLATNLGQPPPDSTRTPTHNPHTPGASSLVHAARRAAQLPPRQAGPHTPGAQPNPTAPSPPPPPHLTDTPPDPGDPV